MPLVGVHLLLTYKCSYECDHCFVWSSPSSEGTMSTKRVNEILRQAAEIPTVKWVYFEGGEPFLFYPILVKGVEKAREMGFRVGIVSNAYWATDKDDAIEWLAPIARHGVEDLSLSKDEYHGKDEAARNVRRAHMAAKELSIPVGILSIRGVEFYSCVPKGRSDKGELFFRGRAAVKLAPKAIGRPWRTLDKCPEQPSEAMRVHIDAFGNVQFCQGITIGNLLRRPLKMIVQDIDLSKHPIIGPLLSGGPSALAMERNVRPKKHYADACHMCYDIRCALRKRGELKRILLPDQAYGEGVESHS